MLILISDQGVSALISYIPLAIFWLNHDYTSLTISGVILTFYSIGLALLRGTHFNLIVKNESFNSSEKLRKLLIKFAIILYILLISYLQFTFPNLNSYERLMSITVIIGYFQEYLREKELATGKNIRAFSGDIIWLSVSVISIAIFFLIGYFGFIQVFVGWGMGGLVSISYLSLFPNRESRKTSTVRTEKISKEAVYLGLIPFVGFFHTLTYTYLYSRDNFLGYLLITKAIQFCVIPLNFIINFQQFALSRDLHLNNIERQNSYFRMQRLLIIGAVLASSALFTFQFLRSFQFISHLIGFGFALAIAKIGISTNPLLLKIILNGRYKRVFGLRLAWLLISVLSFGISLHFSKNNALFIALLFPELILFAYLKSRNEDYFC